MTMTASTTRRSWATGAGGAEGEVRFDRGSRRLYSFDASVYRQTRSAW